MGASKVKNKVLTDADMQDALPILTDEDMQDAQEMPGVGPSVLDEEPTVVERLKAALLGNAQGVTGGYAPQIGAAIDPMVAKAVGAIKGVDMGPTPSYVQRRDAIAKEYQDAHNAAPNWYGGGELAGAIAMGSKIPGGAAKTLPGKMASGALGGALLAGLANPGDQPGKVDPFQMDQRGINTAMGGILGGGAPMVASGLVKGAGVLKRFSERQAFKGLGPYAKAARQALQTDVTSLPAELEGSALQEELLKQGPLKGPKVDQASDIGRTLLDEKIIGNMPVSHEKLAERAAKLAKKKGAEIGSYLGELEDATGRLQTKMAGEINDAAAQTHASERAASQDRFKVNHGDKNIVDEGLAEKIRAHDAAQPGPPQASPGLGVDRKSVADAMRDELLTSHSDIPGAASKNRTVKNLIDQFEKTGDKRLIPVIEAEAKKVAVGKTINWRRLPMDDVPVAEQVNRSLYSKLRQGVEDAATMAESQVGGPSVGKFQRLKRAYGNLSKASAISEQRAGHELSKSLVLPGTGFALGASYTTHPEETIEERLGNGVKGALIAGAARGLWKILPQINANAASKGSLLLNKGADVLGNKNPWATGMGLTPFRPFEEKLDAK